MIKVVKRFLLILPVMFCMVLGLAVPAVSSSYYIQTWNGSFAGTFTPYSSSLSDFEFRSDIASMISSCSADVLQPYIAFSFCSQDSSVLPTLSYYSCSAVFACQSEFGSLTYHTDFYNGFPLYIFDDTSYGFYYSRFVTDGHSSSSQSGMWRNIYGFSVNPTSHELIIFDSQDHISTIIPSGCIYEFESNLPELSNNLDVSVEFQPALSGTVDRTITNGSGASGLSQQLKMRVINNCRFAIQYDMQIVKTEQNKLRDWTSLGSYSSAQEFNEAVFDDDPIFIYYDNDWVYAHSLDDSGSYFNGIPTKQQKSTQYHYLAAGASDDVTFNYSQINLEEGCSYTVTVRAVKCDYDCASELLINAIEDVYPEMKQISLGDLEVVYSSSFSMLQYKDVKYDPSDSSNGVVPYDGSKGLSFKERYANSYNAVQNSSGQVDYKSKNLYDDPNSFWNKTYDPSSYSTLYPNYRTGFSNTPSSVNNLSASISNFGSFIQSIFSYFPSGVFAIFNLALVMVVIIAIIKVVR